MRVGAISQTTGLQYWFTSEQRWQTLVTDAFAVDGPNTRRRRPDFSATEILSGKSLYFGQNDSRSSGLNIFSLTARDIGPDRLVIDIVNVTPIRLALLTLYAARALRSTHIVERLDGVEWGYYGISAVQTGPVAGHEKSFINRATAYYRFLIGQPADNAPPAAP